MLAELKMKSNPHNKRKLKNICGHNQPQHTELGLRFGKLYKTLKGGLLSSEGLSEINTAGVLESKN